jgi:outer membrane receptor protein involved in Fe transport
MNANAIFFAALLATTAPAAYAADAAVADASTDTNGAAAGEIIVTGQKSNRTLQETPASVAVATSERITNENLLSVYDLLDRTPNLMVDGNRTTFSIRGIDAFSVSGGGDGALASVYLDGAVLPKVALTTGPLDLYDIAQVEVFRGPQSTVQGRNALAGAVIIRTADPSYDWSGRARLMISDKDGQRRAAAAIGGPLLDGEVAFRVAGEIARADGLIQNVTVNRDGDRRKSETLRAKLMITPSAIPGLKVIATFMHDRHQRGTFYSEFDAPYDPRDRIATEDVPDIQTVKSDIATLEIGYDLGSGLSLHSATNYSDIRFRSLADPDRSATPGQTSRVFDPSKTFQQELRLNIDKDWVHGLVGAYYLRDDNRDYFFEATQSLNLTRLGVDRQLLAMGLPQATVKAVMDLYGGVVPIRNSLSQPRLTENYAGFADLTFPVTDRFRINAGLRYDHETQDRGATQSVVIDRALPDPAKLPVPALAPIVTQLNALLRATAANANSVEPVRPVTYQAWLPKIGATYDIARDVSISVTAQRGYRSGGSGLNQQRAQAYDYDPEYTWNYEFAFRSEWFDRRLTLNANLYRIDWKDQQVSVQLTPGAVFDTQIVNAGKSQLYGFEIETSLRPTEGLNLYAGLGYSHTKFKDFIVNVGQLFQGAQGNEFARAPHWTVSGGATYRHASGLFANVNANYRSAFFQSTTEQDFRDIPGRTLVNARLGWEGEHFGAFLIVNNVFDVQKPSQFFIDFDDRTRGTLTEPRTIGLSFEGKF